MDLQLQVVIDPDLPVTTEGVIFFQSGEGSYDSISSFFEDLASGKPLPLTLGMHEVRGPASALAATLFLSRDLAILPPVVGLVYLVDLSDRLGDNLLAHGETELVRFLRGVRSIFAKKMSKKDQGENLSLVVQWFREYLHSGVLPNLGPRPEPISVLDVGSNGFVLAQGKPCLEAWETLFRTGYLKGAVLGPNEGDFRQVLIGRKTKSVGYDLERALPILDELEKLSGSTGTWTLKGDFLYSPKDGTTILARHLIEVMLRM